MNLVIFIAQTYANQRTRDHILGPNQAQLFNRVRAALDPKNFAFSNL